MASQQLLQQALSNSPQLQAHLAQLSAQRQAQVVAPRMYCAPAAPELIIGQLGVLLIRMPKCPDLVQKASDACCACIV